MHFDEYIDLDDEYARRWAKFKAENPDADPDDWDDFVGEDDWEDKSGYQLLKEKMPQGWYMIKITNFDATLLTKMEEWVKLESTGDFKRVGFTSGCSTKVAFQFENHVDATFFRLKWSNTML